MKVDKAEIQRALRSPKTRRYGLWIVAAFVLFGVLGFFAFPPLVRHVAVNQLSEALHRPVAIRSIGINPYALSLTVEGLEIKEREGDATFAGFDGLYLNLQASSLFRWGPVIKEIRLTNPRFHVVRLPEGRYNFSDLVDEFMAKPKEEGPTPAFSLNNIQISGGTLELDDRVVGEKHVVGDIALTLPFVSSMAYATDIFVEPSFSANIDGSPVELKGKAKPFAESRESEFQLALDDVQLPKYFDYVPVKLPVKLASGALDTDLAITFHQAPGETPKLVVSGTLAVKDLRVAEAAGPDLLAFKRLDVAVGSADLLAGRFVVDKVALAAPVIGARAGRDGTFNWLEVLPKNAAAGKPAGSSPAKPIEWSLGEAAVTGGVLNWLDESHPRAFRATIGAIEARLRNLGSGGKAADFEAAWKIDGEEWLQVDRFAVTQGTLDLAKHRIRIGEVRLKGSRSLIRRTAGGEIEWIKPPAQRLAEAAHQETAADAATRWTVELAKYVGEDVDIRLEDEAVKPKAVQTIEGLKFELSDLSNEPGQAAALKAAFRLNRKGEIALDGKFKHSPLDAEVNVNAKTVELLPLQPYFSERLNVDITRGQVTVGGNVQLRQSGQTGSVSGGFAGQATVGDFQAVDKLNSADFLRWKSLHLGKVDVRLGPEAVSIGEVALSDFFARVIVNPEGKLNLLQIVRKDGTEGAQAVVPDAAAKAPAASGVASSGGKASAPVASAERAPALPVKIGKITLQGGNVRFTDNFIKPNYTANLREIGGSVTGLSSEAGTQADVELRGSYDNVAPLNLTARVNPLAAKPSLDLQADVKGVELTSLSAYSGKYAGYAIEKGKLSVFVKYKIENDLLEAENRVFLDQLTFGDAVDSPDATKLPVRLAVSLLKNRNGEIDINLPISGSLNDPQFSVGGLIVKVIVNLLAKAVTSPFALIGSMFGGGEELSYVEFDAGRAALTPDAVKRLENLAKALIDRPALKFEIEGRADPEQDVEGLKRARIDRKVRALKREEMTKRNVESGAAEAVEVSDKEYAGLLERVYKAENFPKPRNMIGLVKSLPVEEMEKLILANSAVDEDDLKDLGDRRARSVRDWLVAHEVPAERIFLVPSKVGAAGAAADGEKKSGRRADFSLK